MENSEIESVKEKLRALDRKRDELAARLTELERRAQPSIAAISPKIQSSTSSSSPAAEKIAIFRDLFSGREDVYPKRWDNLKTGKSGYAIACGNEWVKGLCEKPRIKCGACRHQDFLPVTDDSIRSHLQGSMTMGVYPLLEEETCRFLVADFDKKSWQADVSAFLRTCREKDIPAYVERSRSGNGAHVWIFFDSPVPASDARKLGSYLLTETMEHHPDIDFSSYDRLFPNQDTMPAGGFGNLIALPLQYAPRQAQNSLFVDENFTPYEDQWAFLGNIKRMSPEELSVFVYEAVSRGRITGVRMPLDEEEAEKPWTMRPSRKPKGLVITELLPSAVTLVLADQIYIPKESLPPKVINRLIRTAAFQNPEFYRAQAMRLSTFDKPRIIACAENFPDHIALPRGCLEDVETLFQSLGITLTLKDERNQGCIVKTKFLGQLNEEQTAAVNALLKKDTGILYATTGFGKTVMAADIIAKRKRNTLILVHRRQLLDQWIARLKTFLDTGTVTIGQIGGGKKKPSGMIDVALIQSLVKKGDVDDCVAEYGQLIVDECHHLSAISFEAVARRCKAKYVLGLTATLTRKDGHHPIITMQCGPVRYHVDPKEQARKRPFRHIVLPRYTAFCLPRDCEQDRTPIQSVYAALVADKARNEMIFEDILCALKKDHSPVLLTERKEHLDYFAGKLEGFVKNIVTLKGGMGTKQRQEVMERLNTIPDNEERILIATGRYLGEGFDDARLDTLFLAMPISWKGTLAQYAGRLHRLHHDKKEVRIYDYIDRNVPVLERMSEKRISGYKSIGYEMMSALPG